MTYTPLPGSRLALTTSAVLFWGENAASFREKTRRSASSSGGNRTTEAMKSRVTWMIAFWLFIYMGAEGGMLWLYPRSEWFSDGWI